ncbi:zinc-binding dehydrogenase [Polymorphospora rubra]|uniref:zinc-binding dehydrogenase n=1 Tax=Polymorphospora rubra TaxID=338584 RepID=UPI0033C6EF98
MTRGPAATVRRTAVVERHGAPHAVRIRTDEVPEPGPGQVRVRVLAAGIARADTQMRAGTYPGRTPRPPFVTGWDLAGTVEAVGDAVADTWLGQPVVALVLRGAHASHVRVPAADLVALPAGVDPALAASLPLNYLTAYGLLHHAGRAGPGDRILVHGAAGAVGTALLDLARRFGFDAAGTAAARDRDLVESYGARFLDREGTLPAGRFDVALDPIGGGSLVRSWWALRRGGRLVSYGFAAHLHDPRRQLLALRDLLRLRAWPLRPGGRRTTFYRLSRTARRDPRSINQALASLVADLADGHLNPVIAARFALDEATDAHRLLERGGVRGKVLLIP